MKFVDLITRSALVLGLALPALPAADTPLERARTLYSQTDYEGALRTLKAIPDKSGPAYELIGKSYFMKGDFKRASEAFEKAVQASPGESVYHNWLGRAYGRRAETASFLTAPRLAAKARQSFERAVSLDPRNVDAVSDLFEYYMEAPGIMGGGLEKAAGLSERVRNVNPAEYHSMRARLAEKQKEFNTAEEQFRLAVQLAPRQVGRILDLARFFAKRGRFQESEDAFTRAQALAPDAPRVLFERAAAYVSAGRNLDTARALLQRYLQATLTPDDPPRHEAEKLLKQLSAG